MDTLFNLKHFLNNLDEVTENELESILKKSETIPHPDVEDKIEENEREIKKELLKGEKYFGDIKSNYYGRECLSLNEAIEHSYKKFENTNNDDLTVSQCEADHLQLFIWLRDYRRLKEKEILIEKKLNKILE